VIMAVTLGSDGWEMPGVPGRRRDVGGRWGYSPTWQGLTGEALNRHHGAPKIALKGARHERGTGELVHGGVRSEAGLALAGGEHLPRSFGEVESAP
jgi:hypothetical protein